MRPLQNCLHGRIAALRGPRNRIPHTILVSARRAPCTPSRSPNFAKVSLRHWMGEAGWRKKPKRRHPPSARRGRMGELVQIDGSPHDWFEGRGPKCTLIAFIDDATSSVMAASFAPTESTQAYFDVLQAYIKAHGCPVALYSDCHGIFTKHDPEDFVPTQFQRAATMLPIATLQAPTPKEAC